jgi:hypothetical protein
MNKIKLGKVFIVAVVLFAVVILHAQAGKQVQPKKAKQKAASEIRVAPIDIPQKTPLTGSKQEYQLVADVLDSFGGSSESENYSISANSGGQPSAISVSQGEIYVIKAGFVHASFVMLGDATADGEIDVDDVVCLISYLFRNGPPPCPLEAGNANSDGEVSVGDVVFLIGYLFRGGPPPEC